MLSMPSSTGRTGRLITIVSLILLAGVCLVAEATARGRSQPAGDRHVLIRDGIARSYVVRLPPALPSGTVKVPLVLVLHGGGGNAGNAETMTGFTAKGRAEGFIVVYPEGTGGLRGKLLTWNAVHCCGRAMQDNVDDVGFIRELVDTLVERYPVDPRRIYATGMSNGGMMVHRLGIELSDRIAAIAPVVATVFGDERAPRQPVSALIINGALDRNVPNAGGPPGGRFSRAWDGTPTQPALAQASFWATANRCGNGRETRDQGGTVHRSYPCPDGRSVESYVVSDNGHAWPGGERGSRQGDPPGMSVDATEVIWNFFRAQVK